MKKIEPVAYMTYKGYLLHAKDPKVQEHSEPSPLWTDDALQAVAEAVRDATWRVSGEGWSGEYPGDAKPDVDIAAIINQMKGE